MADFHFQPIFELGDDATPYRKLGSDHVRVVEIIDVAAGTGLVEQRVAGVETGP